MVIVKLKSICESERNETMMRSVLWVSQEKRRRERPEPESLRERERGLRSRDLT